MSIRFLTVLCLAAVGCAAPAVRAPVVASQTPAAAVAAPPVEGALIIADPSPVDEHAQVEDESEEEEHASGEHARVHAHAPAMALDDGAFARALKDDPGSLGPMSVGRPSAGLLVGGVQLPETPGWRLVDPGHAWGTQEAIDSIGRAVQRVRDRFENTPPVAIGHISARRGGPLSPHKSHQAGRDLDIGYYYTTQAGWFARATAQNLDRARTWELVKSFAEDAEMIFIDASIQRLLRDYALSHGEDKDVIDRMFQSPGKHWTVVRHIPGHATHIHVRFASPMACELGARAEPVYRSELARVLIAARARAQTERHAGNSKTAPAGADKAKTLYVEHRVRAGDTLYRLAQHYGVSVEAIQQANGLKGFALKPKMVLRIPKG